MAAPAKKTAVSPKAAPDPWAQFEFEMDLPVSLKAGSPSAGKDPVQARRDSMLGAIELQKLMWLDPEHHEERQVKGIKKMIRPREWWKAMGDTIYLTPRYGTRFFKVRPDAPIAKLKREQVVPFLDTLKEAVIEGKFDSQMEALAKRKRT